MTTSAHEFTLRSLSPEQTLAIGRELGRSIDEPLVIGLIGPLGAGKTVLVRGIAEGLETPDANVVSSPTFVLLQQYPGRIPIYHFDTYRLSSAEEFQELGPEEYFESDSVCLIEWADRCQEVLPRERLEIQIEISGPTERRLIVRCLGDRACNLGQTLERM